MREMNRNTMWIASGAACAGIAAYFAYRYFANRPKLSHEVEEKLPLAKHLPTITDFEANYDIDGVSYDIEGVIISGDGVKPIVSPI